MVQAEDAINQTLAIKVELKETIGGNYTVG